MIERRTGIHYAWWIFFGCCSLTIGGFALVYSLAGVYLLPVSTALNLDTANVSMWLTADGFAALVAMPIAGFLLQRKHIGRYMTMGALLTVAGVAGFAFAHATWHFMICGILIGFGMPYLYGIAEVTLIGNWFAVKHQGRFLGMSMGCLGLSAAVWAPLFTYLIQAFGYQTAYLINASLIAVLILPWTLFIFKRDPEEKGLLPYGLKEGEENSPEADAHFGVAPSKAFKTLGFWMVLIAACSTGIGMAFDNHQPAIAAEFLVPYITDASGAALFGGWMISCYGIGQVAGTVIFGWLLDKINLKAVFGLFLTMFCGTFVVWAYFTGYAGLIAGALLLGTHNGLACVGYPLLLRRMFGGKYFSRIYSIVNMACAFFGGVATTIVSLSYDVLGTYERVIIAAIFFILVLASFCFIAISRIGKYKIEE